MVDTFKILAYDKPMILRLNPNSDGYINDFSPSSGVSNYLLVDDTYDNPDDDTTYNSAVNTTGKDFYEITDPTISSDIIDNIRIRARFRIANLNTGDAIPNINIGITTDDGSNISYSNDLQVTNTYKDFSYSWSNNPNTTSAWTWNSVASLEIGLNYGDTTTFTDVLSTGSNQDDGDSYADVLLYGDYIIAACGNDGLRAYTYDGDNLTLVGSIDDGGIYNRLGITTIGGTDFIISSAWIYATSQWLRIYTFNGTTFTLRKSQVVDSVPECIDATGKYLFIGCGGGTYVYEYNDSAETITLKDSDLPNLIKGINFVRWVGGNIEVAVVSANDGLIFYTYSTEYNTIDWKQISHADGGTDSDYDGTYLHVARNGNGLSAYSYDGVSTITKITTIDDGGSYYRVRCEKGYIICSIETDEKIRIYTFDGSTYTQVLEESCVNPRKTRYDGDYLYVTRNGDGLRAYNFLELRLTQMYAEVEYTSDVSYNIERPEKLKLQHTRNTNRINLWDDSFHTYDINRSSKKLNMNGIIHNNPDSAVSLTTLTGSTVSITNLGSLTCYEGDYKIEDYNYTKISEKPELYKWNMTLEATDL